MKIIKYILFIYIIYQLLDTYKFEKNNKIKLLVIFSLLFFIYYNLAQKIMKMFLKKKLNIEDLFKKIDKNVTISIPIHYSILCYIHIYIDISTVL